MTTETILHRFSEFIAENLGLNFPGNRLRDLDRGMVGASRDFGFEEPAACIEWLMATPLTKAQTEILASHLTVGETYFFREKSSFEALEQQILPALTALRHGSARRLRIWDVGCSTGEEPYSLAILVQRVVPDFKEWDITILATDMNPLALRRASAAEYGEWSFRGTPPWVKERYCRKTADGRFAVVADIKKMVTFSYHNVAEDSYPSLLNNLIAMDVILCCNVLMYFTPERAGRVFRNFLRTLVDGGWLVLGPIDALSLLPAEFVRFDRPDVTIFQKRPEGLITPLTEPAAFAGTMAAAKALAAPVARETGAGGPHLPERPTPYDEALSLYEKGRYAEAVTRLLTFRQDPAAYALLAKAYANQGKLAEAIEGCEKAIACDKLMPTSHYLLAMILQEQGHIPAAMAALRRVLYLDQGFVLAHVGLGNLALRMGMHKESRKHFANAISLLTAYPPEAILPESEGITAGRLMEAIEATIRSEVPEHGREAA